MDNTTTNVQGREIKYRAFDKKGDGMFYNVQDGISFDDGSRYTFDQFLNPKEDDIHEWVIMQFTGRTDKTPPWADKPVEGSIDLYEGDIVEGWVSRWPDKKTRGWIEYNNHAQAFQLRYENCFNGHVNEFLHQYHFFDKIGNIYEHPHLLKTEGLVVSEGLIDNGV